MKTEAEIRKHLAYLSNLKATNLRDYEILAAQFSILTWVLSEGPDLKIDEWPVVDLRKDEVRR